MAFNALPGLRIAVSQYQQTFIIGDFFAVFEGENQIPDVYRWVDATVYAEEKDHFLIGFDRIEYIIPKNCFDSGYQIIHFRTIAEGQLTANKNIQLKLKSRIIPPKNNYHAADLTDNIFSGTGVYSEKEINAGSTSHVYGKFKGIITLAALIAAAVTFICLWIFGNDIEKNWLYYTAISFFTGVGVMVLIYLIFCVIARRRYTNFLRNDVSTVENIVFVVAPDGFGAVEQCVYAGKELIPWSNASYFYETKFSVAIVCKDKSVCVIPKRFFQKSSQNDLVEFIAGRVEQD